MKFDKVKQRKVNVKQEYVNSARDKMSSDCQIDCHASVTIKQHARNNHNATSHLLNVGVVRHAVLNINCKRIIKNADKNEPSMHDKIQQKKTKES